jgi:hypothetical protein
VKQNPYRLAWTFRYRFLTADRIAEKLGLPKILRYERRLAYSMSCTSFLTTGMSIIRMDL